MDENDVCKACNISLQTFHPNTATLKSQSSCLQRCEKWSEQKTQTQKHTHLQLCRNKLRWLTVIDF